MLSHFFFACSLKGQLPSKMTLQNSFAVPFFSSAVLFGFWCLLKYFPDLDLKVILKSYLFLVGSIAVGSNVGEPLARLLQPLAAIKTSVSKSSESCPFLCASKEYDFEVANVLFWVECSTVVVSSERSEA